MHDDILLNFEITKEIPKAREGIKLLKKLGLITPKELKDLEISIDALEKKNFVFITKPFRRHEATEEYMYNLMQSRKRAFLRLLERNKEGLYED